MKICFYILLLVFIVLFFSCNKQVSTTPTPTNPLDTIVTGNIAFTESAQNLYHGNTTITVQRSAPCYPSHEIYFFTANNSTITDTINTTYTWRIYMAATIELTGKKAQYIFPIKGEWEVELEIKTNDTLIDTYKFKVYPFGQRVNNINVSIHADCIDNNRKNFISLYSTHNAPLDGYVNAIYWDFDDGTFLQDTNYLQHEFPKLPYDKDYYVKLFIYNTSGCKDSAMLKVFVPAIYNKQVKFTYTQTDPCKPNSEEFTFTADTTGMPADAVYDWDFKDYIKEIKGITVKHKFTFPNRYDVTLRVWHDGRMISEWYDTTVRAKGQNITPIAYFYSSVEEVKADSVRHFFNCQSKFDNGTYLDDIEWSFGDGTIIHRPKDDYNARYTYPRYLNDSTYFIRMIITGSTGGCKDTSYTKITIPKM